MEYQLSLTDQKFCAWCSGILLWKESFAACQSCGKHLFLNPRPCTAIFVLHENNILFLKRSIEPKKGFLDLPGGFVDLEDESIEDGAIRELDEEIGINIKKTSLSYIGSNLYRKYSYQGVAIPTLTSYFLTSVSLQRSKSIQLDHENSDFTWIPLQKIKDHELAFDVYWEMIDILRADLAAT